MVEERTFTPILSSNLGPSDASHGVARPRAVQPNASPSDCKMSDDDDFHCHGEKT